MNGLILKEQFNIASMQESFISYLDVSDKTIKSYKDGINAFALYMKDNDIKTPVRQDIINFRNMLLSKYKGNTVNSYMVAIRSMFKYLKMQGLYENITENVKGARISNVPKTQVLSSEQASYIYKNLTDKREKALFSLLITTGLRGIEVSNAMIEDIKEHNGELVLWVKCKGHSEKDDFCKLSNHVVKDIKDYIGDRTSGYIFVGNGKNNTGGQLTTKTIRLIIKNIFKRFNLDFDYFSLHTTRRSFATISYNLGADVKQLQMVLHHVNLNTTMRYINSSTRDNSKIEFEVSNAILD